MWWKLGGGISGWTGAGHQSGQADQRANTLKIEHLT